MDIREKLVELLDTNCGYVDEEEPDEIAMQFLCAKAAIDRLIEMFANDPNTAEILTAIKSSLEIIENGEAR